MLPAPAKRTHCPHGHEYTTENTIHMKVKRDGEYTGQTKRQCRACKSQSRHVAKPKASDTTGQSATT